MKRNRQKIAANRDSDTPNLDAVTHDVHTPNSKPTRLTGTVVASAPVQQSFSFSSGSLAPINPAALDPIGETLANIEAYWRLNQFLPFATLIADIEMRAGKQLYACTHDDVCDALKALIAAQQTTTGYLPNYHYTLGPVGGVP